jgi:hypothetical protein
MPCYVEASIDNEEYITIMLCRACKFLTKEQMQSITGIDVYISLYAWYLDHLLKDFGDNYDTAPHESAIAVAEAKRLGATLSYEDGMPTLRI